MQTIPLFPLPLVLFPGGKLALQIYEPRYLDLISQCLKQDSGFGIVMLDDPEDESAPELVQVDESESASEVSAIGTYVKLVDFDQSANGLLGIVVEGQKKFCVHELFEEDDGLMIGQIEFLLPESTAALPEEKNYLAELLESLSAHEAISTLKLQIDFQDALDVGSRLAELIPCSNSDKQLMLEMDEPLVRLEQLALIVAKLQKSAWL